MTDQAHRLRRMAQDTRAQMPRDPWGTPTLVIGSGKGGVGKSVVSALFAAELARTGSKVLLLDGDFNLGNLHILMNVQPKARLETLLHDDTTPDELVVRVDENLFLLPNDSGGELLHALGSVDKARLYHRLTGISNQFDLVVVDAGAGIESMVRCTSVGVCHPVVVTIPEPAALADAYAVIKIIKLQVSGVDVAVLVNRVDGDAQGQAAFNRLNTASERFLQTSLNYLGACPEHETLRDAIRHAQPFWHATDEMQVVTRHLVDHARSAFGLEPVLSAVGADTR